MESLMEARLSKLEAEIAKLQERTQNQAAWLEKFDARIVQIGLRVEESNNTLREMSGGRKMLFGLFAAAGSVGALIATLLQKVFANG